MNEALNDNSDIKISKETEDRSNIAKKYIESNR